MASQKCKMRLLKRKIIIHATCNEFATFMELKSKVSPVLSRYGQLYLID